MKPTVGRIVHFYYSDRGADYGKPARPEQLPQAAMIIRVHDEECVNLMVFGEDGNVEGMTSIFLSEGPAQGHWSWPPREPAATEEVPA